MLQENTYKIDVYLKKPNSINKLLRPWISLGNIYFFLHICLISKKKYVETGKISKIPSMLRTKTEKLTRGCACVFSCISSLLLF